MPTNKKKIKYIIIECFLVVFLVFTLCINIGNYKFNLFINNVIGSKFGIIQNLEKINKEYSSGNIIFNLFPDEEFLNNLKEREDILFVGKNIPTYLEIESNDKKAPLHSEVLKLVGTDQRYSYDFLIEKINLVEGTFFSDDELKEDSTASIISRKYADTHQLKIGDTYIIKSVIHDLNSQNHEHIEIKTTLKVTGIFEPNNFSEINEDSEESKFNKEMINTTIYVSNETSKKIISNQISEEINAFPQNKKDIRDPYGNTLTSKEDIINYLNKEKYYEISIIPKAESNISKIEKEIAKLLRQYPHLSLINTSYRYKKMFILGDYAIPLLILSVMLLIFFNVIFYFNISENSTNLKESKNKFLLKIVNLYVGANIGILLVKYYRPLYLNFKINYSNDMPKDYELYSYNILDKVILTDRNISEIMAITNKELLIVYCMVMILILLISLSIFYFINYKRNGYRRL